MRNLRKQFEKLLLLLAFKMDADPVFQRRFTIARLCFFALIGMIIGYKIFLAFLWLFVTNYFLFNCVLIVLIAASAGWILYTEYK